MKTSWRAWTAAIAAWTLGVPALSQEAPIVLQEDKIMPAGLTTQANLGYSLSMDADRIVAGAWLDSEQLGLNAGAAYLLARVGGAWTVEQKLLAPDAEPGDQIGFSVDIAGGRIVLGAPRDNDQGSEAGCVHVFEHDGTAWVREAKLYAASPQSHDFVGTSAAVDGDTVAAGAYLGGGTTGTGPGQAHVFVHDGSAWTYQALLVDSDGVAGDRFGDAIDIDGNTIAVGAPGFHANAVFVYVRTGTSWSQEAVVRPDDLFGGDALGFSVALDGDTLVVGAPENGLQGYNSGAAYVFVRRGTTWTQQARLWRSDAASSDRFGTSVAVRGDVALVGAVGDEAFSGAAYRFERTGTTWTETNKLVAEDRAIDEWVGSSVGLDGDSYAVGSRMNDQAGHQAGAVYVFGLVPGTPGSALCFGDGTGTPCPCGNDSPEAGEGCLHSGGRGMRIVGAGSTSISADDLALAAQGCPHRNSGIFYVGRTSLAPGAVLYDGLQCAGGDVRRFQGRYQDAGTATDTDFVAQDPSGVYFQPGVTYTFQYWTRDVADGVSPCSTFGNLSPAYAVTMSG